jgi:type VI secretion system secreted protein VgrG
MRVVPALWLLTKKAGSCIFQHMSVKDILADVLSDLDVDMSRLEGLDDERDYCVQYQETDFNFVSRLMEEEGILYYFEHDFGSHTMVLVNNQTYTPMPDDDTVLVARTLPARYEDHDYVTSWSKTQEIRSRRYVLRDQSFELTNGPGDFQQLEFDQTPAPEGVTDDGQYHRLSRGITLPNGSSVDLEIYQFPGEFAQRFDGVDRNGSDRPDDVQKVTPDGERTVAIRMAEETTPSLLNRGMGYCKQFEPGHWFNKKIVLDGYEIDDGQYLLVSTSHVAMENGYRSGTGLSNCEYYNNFTAIPLDLPYVPQRRAPKPVIQGPQTAVVVGMTDDDDIFTDKYGRVKVQFHWDRDGEYDADSSCWVRVATPVAGPNWGMIHIPRVGWEVVVSFEDGDPDRPLILGCVYNQGMMPPYQLPEKRTQSGYKTRSSPNGDDTQFNELRFEDKANSEEIYLHAQKDFTRVVENNDSLTVGSPDAPEGSQTVTIYKDQKTVIQTGKSELEAKQSIELKVGDSSIKLDGQSIELKVGDTSIKLDKMSIVMQLEDSKVTLNPVGVAIEGKTAKMESQLMTQIKSQLMTGVSSDLIAQVKGMPIMIG